MNATPTRPATNKLEHPVGPKIFAICVVRDEADVIEETLTAASRWADRILVMDNGSDDDTWDIVQDLGKRSEIIVPYIQDRTPFTDSIRAKVFQAFQHHASDNDWWCRLDADEQYIDLPSVFLRKVPDQYDVVYGSFFFYYFTDRDLQAYTDDPQAWLRHPVAVRLRSYRNTWVAPRFVRHRATTPWVATAWPDRRLRAYPTLIWVKNFEYRSPEQMLRRRQIRATTPQPFRHEFADWPLFPFGDGDNHEPWRRRIADHRQLDYDTGDLRLYPRLAPFPPTGNVRRNALQAVRRTVQRLGFRRADWPERIPPDRIPTEGPQTRSKS